MKYTGASILPLRKKQINTYVAALPHGARRQDVKRRNYIRSFTDLHHDFFIFNLARGASER